MYSSKRPIFSMPTSSSSVGTLSLITGSSLPLYGSSYVEKTKRYMYMPLSSPPDVTPLSRVDDTSSRSPRLNHWRDQDSLPKRMIHWTSLVGMVGLLQGHDVDGSIGPLYTPTQSIGPYLLCNHRNRSDESGSKSAQDTRPLFVRLPQRMMASSNPYS